MEHTKDGIAAYFTVEAALVLPIVLGVIVYIIYFQLFWYNRCLMDQETAMLAMKAVRTISADQKEFDSSLMEWKEQYIGDKYIGWKQNRISYSLKQNQLSMRQMGSLDAPGSGWESEVQYVNKQLDPVFFIRVCRKIKMKMEEKNEE